MAIGGPSLVSPPVYGPPCVRDLRGVRRRGTLRNLDRFIKLAGRLPAFNPSGSERSCPRPRGRGAAVAGGPRRHASPALTPFAGCGNDAASAGDLGGETMDLGFPDELREFRQEVRAFIEEHLPADLREKVEGSLTLEKEDYLRWQDLLAERGWFVYSWPAEYGGPGWSPLQCHLFQEELGARRRAADHPLRAEDGGPGDLHLRQRRAEGEVPDSHREQRLVRTAFHAGSRATSPRTCHAHGMVVTTLPCRRKNLMRRPLLKVGRQPFGQVPNVRRGLIEPSVGNPEQRQHWTDTIHQQADVAGPPLASS